ncbi:MAG: hypothetical protein ACOX44_17505 [Limnochordia bacterium]|jgi:epoxyqueuosine reductase QueG
MSLKEHIKNYAYELGADLIGFGSVERCKHAPLMMSPQGLYPAAKTVIVMALHHPDACIELGGERHSQEIGPYSVQYLMNTRLDFMSYQMATFLEKAGYGAIPIASSNIWRYKQYKQLDAIFAPDISHIYMAVVAGLADIGYNGLAITPEYGARNRFVTVVTDAEIEEDPLIPPGTVCDQCMLCRRHCPSQALSKEIKGDKVLRIGPYEYRFPNKNLWRCAWGEHFDLDLDLPIPDVVDEEVILKTVAKHGFRGGEMGQCLKFCVPKSLRTFDKSYSKSPMRKLAVTVDQSIVSRKMIDRLLAKAAASGVDTVLVSDAEELSAVGIDLDKQLPGAQSAVTVLVKIPPVSITGETRGAATNLVDFVCFDLTRELEELGIRSVMTAERSGMYPDDPEPHRNVSGSIIGKVLVLDGRNYVANTVVTRMSIPAQVRESQRQVLLDRHNVQAGLSATLRELSHSWGADLFGIASVERCNALAEQLRPYFDGEEILDARDQSPRFTPWQPKIIKLERRIKTPEDYLPGAKSVIVIGVRLHSQVVQQATRPPAEAVGPYAFQTYITSWVGARIGLLLIKQLEKMGHQGVMVRDLMNTASVAANPRGLQPDLRTNRFAAVAAGLGYLTDAGHAATPQFGIKQRFIAIVTNAELEPSEMMPASERFCAQCEQMCMSMCPSQAFTDQRITLSCEGQTYSFVQVDTKRCDWSKRYTLTGESGYKYLGSQLDIRPEGSVEPEQLNAGLTQLHPISKYRPVVAEPCVINCPYGNDGVEVGKRAGDGVPVSG